MNNFCDCFFSDFREQIIVSHYCSSCGGVTTEECDQNCATDCPIACYYYAEVVYIDVERVMYKTENVKKKPIRL
jgi:hypothetical protein